MIGRSNRLIRRLRLLRRDAAARRAEGVLVAEGEHLVAEALAQRPHDIEVVLVSPRLAGRPDGPALLAAIANAGVVVAETADAVLDSVQDARSAQPVVAVVRHGGVALDEAVARVAPGRPLVVLAGVQDPGNLGSVLRTADAAGAAAAVCCSPGADPTHPRAVRATMGSIYRLPVATASTVDLLAALADGDVALVATGAGAGTNCFEAAWPPRMALAVGGEGAGLPAALLDRADLLVRVPMRVGVESLSLGAAAAVVLFDVARRTPSRP